MILRLPYFSDSLAKLERRSLVSPRSDHGLHDVTFVINGTLEERSLPLIFRKASFRCHPHWKNPCLYVRQCLRISSANIGQAVPLELVALHSDYDSLTGVG
jgi:hypothetical protein